MEKNDWMKFSSNTENNTFTHIKKITKMTLGVVDPASNKSIPFLNKDFSKISAILYLL